MVVWWSVTIVNQGLIRPTACTDLAIGAHADTTGPNTVSEYVKRLAEGGARESAANVEIEVDTGQRLFDWTWLRVRKSGKALRPYHRGPQAAAHRSERYRNYMHQADCPDWEVNASQAHVGDVANRSIATMNEESPWRRDDDSTELLDFQTPLHRPTKPRGTSSDVGRVRKAPSVSTSRGIYATSLGQVGLLAMGHENTEKGVMARVRTALFSPTTEPTTKTSTQVAGSTELSDQAHTQSTVPWPLEREQPVDLTEIDDADFPALTTRQHSVVSEGPVDKGDNKTKTHVEISDPSSDVSGQSQEHQQAAGRERKQEKETETETKKEREEAREEKEVSKETQREKEKEQQRRGLKHRGGPNLAQFLYGALEGERTKHQRRHKDKTDQGSGLSVGFH